MFTKNSRFGIIKLYMINKGELYMEYGNTDEATRREACERVKQIVKAIKAIKIKYYLNFSKISAKDQETYQKLEANLEQISEKHDLNNLKVALMQEVEAKYDGKNPEDIKQGKKPESNEDILQACYGAIDAQKEALLKGRITQALRCQEQLKKYKQELDEAGCQEVTNYKREKFAELMQTREQIEEQLKSWNNTMKGMYKIKDVSKRKETMEKMQSLQNKEKQTQREGQIEMATI